ncbi:hypothetical protein [Dysosmobacter sp.]|uniref:hypothetical protein n=1 Tax=Dysosmobacter sp. TaxID=2591382 RepID=UPI003A9112C7
MEQQPQGRDRQRAEKPTQRETEHQTPERERLAEPGLTAQALLEGVSLLELPPQRLEELAALVGNQGMASLLEQQAIPLEEVPFSLPAPVDTVPFSVPESPSVRAAEPPGLTAESHGGRAFDPAGLAY